MTLKKYFDTVFRHFPATTVFAWLLFSHMFRHYFFTEKTIEDFLITAAMAIPCTFAVLMLIFGIIKLKSD